MPSLPVLIACDLSQDLYARLRSCEGGSFAMHATTALDMADQLNQSEIGEMAPVVLWDISRSSTEDIDSVISLASTSLRRTELFVLLPMGAVRARQVLVLVSRFPDAEVLLVGLDDVLSCITRVMDGTKEHRAFQQMMRPLVTSVSAAVSDIVTTAVLAGHRRITVSTLARLFGLPPRTLVWRLRANEAPQARHMLGWILSLHVLWRLDILRWGTKHTAAVSGFRSVEAMSSFVARQTGCRPGVLLARGGFEQLLDSCVKRW